MTCAYMPDGSTFNGKQNVLPTPYYEALAVGDTLDDDWINPLIYHRDPRRELSKARIPSAMAKMCGQHSFLLLPTYSSMVRRV